MFKILYFIFFFSDLLFPVWWIGIMIVFIRKGLSSWKAWGIASTFCLTQSYLVAKFLGHNLGALFLASIAAVPSIILNKVFKIESSTSELTFWVIPPILLIVIPMLILFMFSKYKEKKQENIT